MPHAANIPALSWQHLTSLAAFAAITTIVIALARRRGPEPDQPPGTPAHRLRLIIATLALLAWLTSLIFYLQPTRFDWSKSLPIELCDLTALIAPLALFTSLRPLRAILHFWAFALCTQFFITPVHTPGSPAFIVGWFLHAAIVGSALFDALALNFRPRWTDLRTAILAGVLYLALIFPFNIATGFNYGYVGPAKPGTPTIVDALGRWPLRVLWISIIAATAMTLVMLINLALRRTNKALAHSTT